MINAFLLPSIKLPWIFDLFAGLGGFTNCSIDVTL